MTRRQPRHGPNDFYGPSGPPTPPGGAWPPPPLWRPAVSPMPARQGPAGSGDGSWPEAQGHAPKPRRPLKHLVGYPATVLLALAVGAAPSDGATSGAASAAAPTPAPTVTVTAPARTVTAPARTVTVTVAAGESSSRSSRSSGSAGEASGVSPGGGSVFYATCAEARSAGDTPLYVGDPGYRPALDRDQDGVACE